MTTSTPVELVQEYKRQQRLRADDVNAIIRAIKARRGSGYGDTDYHVETEQAQHGRSPYGIYDIPLQSTITEFVPPFSIVQVVSSSPWVSASDGPSATIFGTATRLGFVVEKVTDYANVDRPLYLVVDERGIPAKTGASRPWGLGSIAAEPCLARLATDGLTSEQLTNLLNEFLLANVRVDSPQDSYEKQLGPQEGSWGLNEGVGTFYPLSHIYKMPDGASGTLYAMKVVQDLRPRAYGSMRLFGAPHLSGGSSLTFTTPVADATRQDNRNVGYYGTGLADTSGIIIKTKGLYRVHCWGSITEISTSHSPAPTKGIVTIGLRRYLSGTTVDLEIRGDVLWSRNEKFSASAGSYDINVEGQFMGGSFCLHGLVNLEVGEIIGAAEYSKLPSLSPTPYTVVYGNGGLVVELIDRYRSAT